MSRCYAILVFLIFPHVSVQLSVTSCYQSPPSPAWKSTITPKTGQVNGTSILTFEGINPSSGVEFELKYGDKLRLNPSYRSYLFIEYLNESPRRLTVQPVKNEKGAEFSLLPGVASEGWREAVEEIDVAKGEPSITGILKKPQRISIRKLVIFSLLRNSRESVANVVSQLLRDKSCTEVTKLTTPQPQLPQQQQQPTQPPKQTQTCGTSTSTCTTCPECKCVCNCNCREC